MVWSMWQDPSEKSVPVQSWSPRLGTCWVTDKLSTCSATEGWPLTTERRRRRRRTADGRDSKQSNVNYPKEC